MVFVNTLMLSMLLVHLVIVILPDSEEDDTRAEPNRTTNERCQDKVSSSWVASYLDQVSVDEAEYDDDDIGQEDEKARP